jgi:hypothetical protein
MMEKEEIIFAFLIVILMINYHIMNLIGVI